MASWEGSNRRDRLPADWSRLRDYVLRRDGHRCTYVDEQGSRCNEKASEVDHIVAGDDHSYTNLRSLCTPHHAAKSAREGNIAAAKRRREISKRFRRDETHPLLRLHGKS